MAKRSARHAVVFRGDNVQSLHEGGTGVWDPLPDTRDQSYVRRIRPMGPNQQALMDAMAEHSLALALGPAGTGKTFLAISAAVEALEEGRVARIVLSRPAVEAGESLGFLPGDLQEKMAPYLRRSTTPCPTAWAASVCAGPWPTAASRSRPSPICGAERSTTLSWSSTRRRTAPTPRSRCC